MQRGINHLKFEMHIVQKVSDGNLQFLVDHLENGQRLGGRHSAELEDFCQGFDRVVDYPPADFAEDLPLVEEENPVSYFAQEPTQPFRNSTHPHTHTHTHPQRERERETHKKYYNS